MKEISYYNHSPDDIAVVLNLINSGILGNVRTMPIGMYCFLYNETVHAINKRIQRGFWRIGKEVLKPEGSKDRWINLDEVERWARNIHQE